MSEPTAEFLTFAAFQGIRATRNQLLTASDWTQFNDVVLPNREEWAAYRQALRDVTKTTTDPTQVVWPTPPQ